MCGIAGVWSPFRFDKNNDKYIHQMAAQLLHRGPDGRGFHFDTKDGIAMAHTRLSIIDLNSGEQPIHDSQAQLTLTANGEFYDYKRIRGLLTAEGFSFSTKSDSEIALKLYRKYGLSFVDHLRGEFAFALFDAKNQQLILVRDRFGIRPLFYHITGESVYYGSEIKSLLAHPHVPSDISKKVQLHQMMQVMVPGDSLFENIHALKPGHMLIIGKVGDRISVTEKCYWDAEFPLNGEHAVRSDQQHIEAVRETLIESVALRLEADVPVACYLSGGIDSCSILGMASSIQQSPVKAFTISFDDERYDEASIATEMAEKCNADQDILRVSASDLYGKNFEKAIWYSERTFYNTLGIAKMLMSKHVTDNQFKVVITGEGADEFFGGYAAFKRDMFIHDPAYQTETMEALLQASNRVFSGSVLAEKTVSHPAFEEVMGFTPSWIQPWMLVLEQVKPLLSDTFLDLLGEYDPIGAIAYSLDKSKLDGRHPLDKAQYSWIKTMLEGQILNWGGDRVDMANSLESRPAFLDHHVTELAADLPPHVRIRNGVEKWVLREAMKHLLPEVLYNREKFAFMAPPAHTDQNKTQAIQGLIDKYLSPERVMQAGIFNQQAIKNLYKNQDNSEDHTLKTRKDIILNHAIALHAMNDIFMSRPATEECLV
ncbi:asparagine synthase (glutamine-hydrolyzing) [Nitrosomonas marina]|uniref:asparagine synthase (glutamine-hydrolyzing) n=1 Tax=Nitrosomonas marina TaxID=917 RepID=A0A1H8CRD4_9PROT|nr:asparagine synthase (glutamine-hydrolyzing) [Nitrosomonas marina]SEM96858.1 asparagine synthase (glutamine-hydrolysing) [Nitrosomonas marina]